MALTARGNQRRAIYQDKQDRHRDKGLERAIRKIETDLQKGEI
jgi:hypothetical protein